MFLFVLYNHYKTYSNIMKEILTQNRMLMPDLSDNLVPLERKAEPKWEV